MKGKFDFKSSPTKTKWLVQDLIPLGQLVFNLSHAGVGKSFYAEALAVSIVFGQSFLGKDTAKGNVLIIDQDTPEEDIAKRLLMFGKYYNVEPKYTLHHLISENLTLSSGSLIKAINDYKDVVLVIVDSLHSVLGNLNPDRTGDMAKISELKQKCCSSKKVIMVNHHISEKLDIPSFEAMTGSPHKLSMGNSAVIQQADSYYIIASPFAEVRRLELLNIRPVTKRRVIPQPPFTIRLNETEDTLNFSMDGNYIPPLTEAEQDVLSLFQSDPQERYVEQVYKELHGMYGAHKVADICKELHKKQLLKFSRERHNRFKYWLEDSVPHQFVLDITPEEFEKLEPPKPKKEKKSKVVSKVK